MRDIAGFFVLALALASGFHFLPAGAAESEACTDIAAIGEGAPFTFSGIITRTAPPPIEPANLDVAANPPCDAGMDLSNWTRNPIILVYFDELPESCVVDAAITVSGSAYVYEHGQVERDFYAEDTTLTCS